ncbi:hypothetical protein MPER_08959, partial [Moniliophthora perniciosa FA553]
GEYLIRGKSRIALHVASSYPGAQFYIGCAQVKVNGGGSITVNIYNNLQSYTAPGPEVWSG